MYASEESVQPAHSCSLIRILIRCIFDSQGCNVSSCGQRRLWSDCGEVQPDLSLRWAHISECTVSHVAAYLTSCDLSQNYLASLQLILKSLFYLFKTAFYFCDIYFLNTEFMINGPLLLPFFSTKGIYMVLVRFWMIYRQLYTRFITWGLWIKWF